MPTKASVAATNSAQGGTCRRCSQTTRRRDDQEAIATAVSLLAGAAGAGGAIAGVGDAALRALTKLDRVLPTRLRHETRALSGAVEFFPGGHIPVDPDVLMTLAKACRDEVEAGFDYPAGSQLPRRRVKPYRLVASDRRWYLLAYDLDRDDRCTFRADRMTGLSARTWRFTPRTAPDAAAYVQKSVASRVYRHQARFLVHTPADTVRAQIPAPAAAVQPRGNQFCDVLNSADSLNFVPMHMVLPEHNFEVLNPPRAAQPLSRSDRPATGGRYGKPTDSPTRHTPQPVSRTHIAPLEKPPARRSIQHLRIQHQTALNRRQTTLNPRCTTPTGPAAPPTTNQVSTPATRALKATDPHS